MGPYQRCPTVFDINIQVFWCYSWTSVIIVKLVKHLCVCLNLYFLLLQRWWSQQQLLVMRWPRCPLTLSPSSWPPWEPASPHVPQIQLTRSVIVRNSQAMAVRTPCLINNINYWSASEMNHHSFAHFQQVLSLISFAGLETGSMCVYCGVNR